MNFDTSTQRTTWMLPRKEEGGEPDNKDRLLAVRFYAKIVLSLGERCKIRREVILTAMAYVRRYFYQHDLGENLLLRPTCEDVSLLSITAYFLAGKVEEEELPNALDRRGVDLAQLIQAAKPNKPEEHRELEASAIKNEMQLLAQLNFDLLCFHPLRPSLGFLEVWHRKSPLDEFEAIHSALWPFVSGTYLVDDLMFRYPSSVLAMACLVSAMRKVKRGKKKTNLPLTPEFLATLTSLLQEVYLVAEGETQVVDSMVETVVNIADQIELGLDKDLHAQASAAYQRWRGLSPSTPEQE
ncbi:hypothetical protein BASA81_000121 [Batrachochytrium salamandrivorans]|nr:hypothetical protein BASA81_000121 [Batrachochytrium salamandrivorans]